MIDPATEIMNFMKDKYGSTAVCPYCCVDAVVGDASGLTIDKQVLRSLRKAWF